MTPGEHIRYGIRHYPLTGIFNFIMNFGWGMFWGYQLHKWVIQ